LYSLGQYLRLETRGRKTGKTHPVIVRYISYEGNLLVFPQTAGHQDWVANVIANPEVKVYSNGRVVEGVARFVNVKSLADPVLSAFTRKYGIAEVKKKYWGATRYLEVHPASESSEDYYEFVYEDLEAAFDGVAEDYDEHILGNPINLWLRNRSVSLLSEVFSPGDTIVEVGCGTGTETLALAKRGIKVVATDISSRMLAVLERKAIAEGLRDRVTPVQSRPYQLKASLEKAGIRTVDGAYSTYGAVNTDPRLPDMAAALHSIIREEGRLILGVWNKFCLYEIAGYWLRLKPSMSVARLSNPVPIGKSRFCISTNSFTVGSMSRVLSKFFKLEEVHGVGIFLPPSNLTRYLPHRRIEKFVKYADVHTERVFPFNRLGDHFLGVYRRV
jgi:deazaflavin-dependent oxidoreductase (nitroreductase family)